MKKHLLNKALFLRSDRQEAAIAQLKKFNATHTLGELNWKMLRDKGRK